MSERTVAEMMGWCGPHEFARDSHCLWCDAIDGLDAFGDCPDNENAPTPDDMLAWLGERLDTIEPAEPAHPDFQPGDKYAVHFWLSESLDDILTAPTLHAALEAAVLAVAERKAQS